MLIDLRDKVKIKDGFIDFDDLEPQEGDKIVTRVVVEYDHNFWPTWKIIDAVWLETADRQKERKQ